MTLEGPPDVRELPQQTVARLFMERKGYMDARAKDVEKLDDSPCWYFFYELPDGDLELEVFFDAERSTWECMVTTFTPVGD